MAPKKATNTRNTSHRNKAKQIVNQQPQSHTAIDLAAEQQVLNSFQHTYPDAFGPGYLECLQEIKKHLYDRDFAAAVGKPRLLDTYCLRWSPSRALAYRRIIQETGISDQIHTSSEETFKVVCLGGGAGAELVALGACLYRTPNLSENITPKLARLKLCLVDIANWDDVLQHLF